jgi:hypothetical protein
MKNVVRVCVVVGGWGYFTELLGCCFMHEGASFNWRATRSDVITIGYAPSMM